MFHDYLLDVVIVRWGFFLGRERTSRWSAWLAVRLDIGVVLKLFFLRNGLEAHRDEAARRCWLKVNAAEHTVSVIVLQEGHLLLFASEYHHALVE